jgi:hypothetical protein
VYLLASLSMKCTSIQVSRMKKFQDLSLLDLGLLRSVVPKAEMGKE